MPQILCFDSCFGRRPAKTYKAEGPDEPTLKARILNFGRKHKVSHTIRTKEFSVDKSSFPLASATMRTNTAEYSEPVEDIRRREYPNMAEGKDFRQRFLLRTTS